VSWRKHHLLSRVASNFVNVVGEKPSSTSTAILLGKITFKTDRVAGAEFIFILDANVTGTRVVSWLVGVDSLLVQYVTA
jgi:hypothetical protein